MTDARGEFDLIDAIVAELSAAGADGGETHIALGPGDDAAIVNLPADSQLATSVDSLLPGVHFPAAANPALIGYRALAVSTSDLASMGAMPLAAVVALVLPTDCELSWVRGLAQGLGVAARDFAMPVTGGNIARGPLSLSVAVQGVVPTGAAILRSGASAGDNVWVSGNLGGAALALAEKQLDQQTSALLDNRQPKEAPSPVKRYFCPQPRLALGMSLRNVATAAIDISDGLAADLGHLCHASGVDVELSAEALPLFPGATREQALFGGDDYELCFTASTEFTEMIVSDDSLRRHGPLIRIGRCVALRGARPALTLDGAPLAARGFNHFAR